MSENADEELERIRERKRERLKQRLEDGTLGEAADEAADAPDEPVHLERADDFGDVVERYDRVLVDFYADWCGPCKTMEPALESVAADTDAAVLKVDVDAHDALAAEFGVRSVPTLVRYEGGDPVERRSGALPEPELRRLAGA